MSQRAEPAQRHAMTWAQRLKRMFRVDIDICEQRDGAMETIASIEDPIVTPKILGHLRRRETAPCADQPSRAPSPSALTRLTAQPRPADTPNIFRFRHKHTRGQWRFAPGDYEFKIANEGWNSPDFGAGGDPNVVLGTPKSMAQGPFANLFLSIPTDNIYLFTMSDVAPDLLSAILVVSNVPIPAAGLLLLSALGGLGLLRRRVSRDWPWSKCVLRRPCPLSRSRWRLGLAARRNCV